MPLFNDIIDLGLTNQNHLNIINFFVYAHLFAFLILFAIIVKGAFKSDTDVFEEEVAKLKQKAKPDNKKN